MLANKKAEKTVLIIVAIVAICLVGFSVYSDYKQYRKRALFYELQILRMGVNIYQFLNYNLPDNLEELMGMTYKFPGDKAERHYVEGINVDGQERLIDPFGNVYNFDKLTGWVRSSTPGFEFW